MGRAVAHYRNWRSVRLALWCSVVMLPALLCACRRHQNLVDDAPYNIVPGRIHFDDELTASEAERISAVDYSQAPAPARLKDRKEIVRWDMPLQEVIFHALANSKVIRQGGQFLSPNNALLRSPEGVPTVYDQAIQSTGVLFGQRGEQAALSEFDSTFTTRMLWGNSTTIQNFNQLGLNQGQALRDSTAQFQASLQRALFSGGQVGFSHSWNYSSNNTNRLFPSAYDGNLRAEFRQPLLAGAGSEYSRIAGPISENIQGVTGVQQGILISRINNSIAMTDFELSVIGYLRDVELQYWKLLLAYQTHEIEQDSYDDAKRILSLVQARANAPGGDLSRLVEAREGVLQSKQRVIEALDAVYTNESQLRLLMGFTLQSERMIYPIDSPVVAELKHDWSSSLTSALALRPEIRRQKAAVKSAELQLIAAENLNRPRFDIVAAGQANGFGDDLMGSSRTDGTTRRLGSAYTRLFRGQETGWTIGAEFSQPLGLRFAHEQVKNNELKLVKARTYLEAQEAEILAELTAAFQAVDRNFLKMQTQAALVENAKDRLAAAEADYDSNKEGRGFLDLDSLNRARDIYSQSVVQLGQSQVEYSMSLTDVEYRCGRLLEYHNVVLSSNPEYAMSAPSGAGTNADQPITPPVLPPANSEGPLPTPADDTPTPINTTSRESIETEIETAATVEYEADFNLENSDSSPEWAHAADSSSLESDMLDDQETIEIAVPLENDWNQAEAEAREVEETDAEAKDLESDFLPPISPPFSHYEPKIELP